MTARLTVLITGELLGDDPPHPAIRPVRTCANCGELVTVAAELLAAAERNQLTELLLILCPECKEIRSGGPASVPGGAGTVSPGGREGPPVCSGGERARGGKPGGGGSASPHTGAGHGDPAARPPLHLPMGGSR